MSGHLEAIGFRGNAWEAAVMEASSAATPAGRSDGFEHYLWQDASGARVLYHAKGGELLCITPSFRASRPSVWEVESCGPVLDDDCLHCSGADFNIPDSRAAVQMELFAPWQGYLERKERFPLEVVGFAHWVQRCADAAAIEKRVGLKLATTSFIPVGMFGTEAKGMTARATAILAGRLEEVERLRNGRTGADFFRLRVATLPGPLDVVTNLETIPGDGDILLAEVWLVGRVQERKD
jgi:hypothetical protein